MFLCTPGFETTGADCSPCAAGYADQDSDASTPCTLCTAGHDTHTNADAAGTGQVSCTSCLPGWADTDSDPATVRVLIPSPSAL